MRHAFHAAPLAAFAVLVLCGSASAASAPGESGLLVPRTTARAREQLLACDSAEVMLMVETSHETRTLPNGTIQTSGSSEVLARGSNGPEWIRRFAGALLPEGREWKLRSVPVTNLDRPDGRVPWRVRVTGFARGEASSFWQVNLLDGWAGEGLGPYTVFDLLGSPDSLRAVLAAGMRADADGGRRLRKIVEPDATIMPLPEHLRR